MTIENKDKNRVASTNVVEYSAQLVQVALAEAHASGLRVPSYALTPPKLIKRAPLSAR